RPGREGSAGSSRRAHAHGRHSRRPGSSSPRLFPSLWNPKSLARRQEWCQTRTPARLRWLTPVGGRDAWCFRSVFVEHAIVMSRFPWAFAALNLAVSVFHVNLFTGWNQVSRALPLVSLVEEGTLQIDSRHELTGDKALVGGHYYSDKAPAATLLALPFYALARAAFPGSRYAVEGPRVGSSAVVRDAILVGTFVCSVLPFLAILLLFVSRLEARAGPKGVASARMVAVWLLYGTYVFVYADYFFGHMLA